VTTTPFALPYPGLRPFRTDESHIFFGRERHTDELLTKLGQTRFLSVVGASGCGKSSLVRAGMIAGLETGFMVARGSRWRVATLRPGRHPIKRLAAALAEETALGPELAGEPHAAAMMNATLARGPLGLVEVLRETPLADRTNLLLLVDQFEELFQDGHASEEAEAFVALLLESKAQTEVPIHVVITMRSDSLGDCARFTGLPEAMNDSQYLTPRLTREQRQAAIERPARVFEGEVEPALVNAMLNEMGSDQDQLPLMQHMLMRLWLTAGGVPSTGADPEPARPRRLTLAAYESAGKLHDALSTHAEEAFNELDPDQKVIAETMFRSLTERGRLQQDVRRAATVAEIVELVGAGVTPEQVLKTAEPFRRGDRSFLTLSPELELEISHESLIRHWRRFADWVSAEVNSIWLYGRLREQAGLWKKGQGALWTTPDLEQGLAWWERNNPTPAWAKRHGGDLGLAREFLDTSDAKKKEEGFLYGRLREQAGLWKKGQGALWTDPDLEAALRWKEWTKPTREWAERWGGDFDLAMEFLEASQALTRAREQAREHRKRTVDRLQWAVLALGILFTAAAATAAALAISANQRGQRRLDDMDFTETSRLLEANRTAEALPRLARALRSDTRDLRARSLLLDALLRRSWPLPTLIARPARRATTVAVTGDGRRMLAVFDDSTVGVWDAGADGIWVMRPPMRHPDAVFTAVFSPDGRRVVTTAADSTAREWDVITGQPTGPARQHRGFEDAAAMPLDAGQAVANRWGVIWMDSAVQILDTRTERTVGEPLRHGSRVVASAISGSGRWVVTFSTDGALRAWDVGAGQTLVEPLRHADATSAAVGSTGRVVTGAMDGTALLWDAATGQPFGELLRHQGAVTAGAFSGDGTRVLTTSGDGSVRVWDVATRQPIGPNLLHRGQVYSAAFAPDGQRALTVSADHTARVWDVTTGNLVGDTLRHDDEVLSGTFSSDGRRVVTASADGTVRWWEVRSGQPVGQARRLGAPGVRLASFSNAGRRLVTVRGYTAQVWNVSEARPFGGLLQHRSGALVSAAISPDGERVVTGSDDRTALVWHVATGRIVATLRHGVPVSSAAFSPDGRQVITASSDGARLWDVLASGDREVALLTGLADALTGSRVDRAGTTVPVINPMSLLDSIRASMAGSSDSGGIGSFVRWFVADRCTRTLSPLSRVTVPAYLDRLARDTEPASLQGRRGAADTTLLSSCSASPTTGDSTAVSRRSSAQASTGSTATGSRVAGPVRRRSQRRRAPGRTFQSRRSSASLRAAPPARRARRMVGAPRTA